MIGIDENRGRMRKKKFFLIGIDILLVCFLFYFFVVAILYAEDLKGCEKDNEDALELMQAKNMEINSLEAKNKELLEENKMLKRFVGREIELKEDNYEEILFLWNGFITCSEKLVFDSEEYSIEECEYFYQEISEKEVFDFYEKEGLQ